MHLIDTFFQVTLSSNHSDPKFSWGYPNIHPTPENVQLFLKKNMAPILIPIDPMARPIFWNIQAIKLSW